MQPHRSCLFVFVNIFPLIYLVLFGGTTYANLRMWWVNYQLLTVAEQLGYTPDALLRHHVKARDWSIPVNTYCYAQAFYTTTLSPAEFGERVVQALPETRGQNWSDREYLSSLTLIIDGVNVREVIPPPKPQMAAVYHWYSDEDNSDMSLTFYDLTSVTALLDYKGLPINGNIVELYKFGGEFQIWNCPTKVTESPNLPRN